MLTIPITTLMSQGLYEEYLFWLQRHGCDEEHAGKEMAYAFIRDVEAGGYEVPCDVKTDAHRLYLEVSGGLPKAARTTRALIESGL
jgi:hypothetical protein